MTQKADNLETALDRLYGFEPGTFVAERDRLARELRAAGQREEAQRVKRLRKPTVSAWAINQLTREKRREIDLLLDAGHRLREAQRRLLAGKDPGSLDEARRTEREALAALRKAARGILAEAGRENDATVNRVMGTLQAAAVSDEGRELLARGRLAEDVEAGGFELLAPLAEGTPAKREAPTPTRRQPTKKRGAAKRENERQRQQLRQRLETSRRQLREAQASASEADKELRAAERDEHRARRELAQAEKLSQERKAAADAAHAAVERAEDRLREVPRKAP